jgi:site-specific DNA-methyltransferase (adenine-specific)
VSKRGDVWILGAHRVMCGDSCSADDISKLFGSTGGGYSDCLAVPDRPAV